MDAIWPITATLFATPDFGAGASILGIIALIWLAVLVGALVGAIRGLKLIGQASSTESPTEAPTEKPNPRRTGLILLLVSAVVPLSCCFGPSIVFRLNYGSYPLSGNPYEKVKEGMSADDVLAVLGAPHNRDSNGLEGGEGWYYYQDSFQIGWFCVDFGPDGRVKGTHGY